MEALRDKLLRTDIKPDEAVRLVSDDWEVKPEVLTIRFERQYGKTPAAFSATLRQEDLHRSVKVTRESVVKIRPCTPGINAKAQPRAENFGLPANFSINDYDKLFKAAKARVVLLSRNYTIILIFLFLAAGRLFILKQVEITTYIAICIMPAIYMFSATYDIVAKAVKSRLRSANGPYNGVLKLEHLVLQYKYALDDWRLTQTESGTRYWQALTGIDFERAVAQLFNRRGCQASLTRVTADGGIDIILDGTDYTYNCQCKGHSKKISVAPVREIAGACSKVRAHPVIISSNGFTQPALSEAQSLGVICIDATGLCRLAALDQITTLRTNQFRAT